MKTNVLLTALMGVVVAAGCGPDSGRQVSQAQGNELVQRLPGDSTVYGLACEGCTDTILIVLRTMEDDPDTFNILDATTGHRIMGRPETGDLMALTVNGQDSAKADFAIDLDKLKGAWCHMVTPQLRRRAGMTDEMRKQMERNMPDSVRQKLLQPREYGFELKSEFTVRPIGLQFNKGAAHDDGPAEYPALKRYREWLIFNGRLVLNESHSDSLLKSHAAVSDTADILMLRRDTLVLRFTDGTEQTYHRKTDS